VDKTGIVKSLSVSQAVSGGAVTAASASNIAINSTSDNFNGIMVNGAEYAIKDSTFNILSKSDGSDISDFDGYGAVIGAFNNARLTVDKVNIQTEGVARLATNLLGTCSTFTVVRTEANAANWGVLSTDGGSEMVMTVVDSTLTLTGQKDPFSTNCGSGHGTYILVAKEYFYGVTLTLAHTPAS
jgi:hypothetical protein